MNFYDFFRNILGIPRRNDVDDLFSRENYNNSTRDNYRNTWLNDDDDDDEDEFGAEQIEIPDEQPFGFKIFSSPLEIHRFFEKQMEEMMKSFHMFESDPTIGIGDFQSLEPPDDGGHGSGKSLRDELFKPGYEYRYPGSKRYLEEKKEDNDLDESIKSSNLGEILDGNPSPHQHDSALQVPRSQTRVFGKSFTSKTIRRPDGSVEHHKIVKDNQGNEEVTVTHQVGDKKYIVVTQTDPSGLVKRSETFQNVEEGEIEEFKRKWNVGQEGDEMIKEGIDFRKFFSF